MFSVYNTQYRSRRNSISRYLYDIKFTENGQAKGISTAVAILKPSNDRNDFLSDDTRPARVYELHVRIIIHLCRPRPMFE